MRAWLSLVLLAGCGEDVTRWHEVGDVGEGRVVVARLHAGACDADGTLLLRQETAVGRGGTLPEMPGVASLVVEVRDADCRTIAQGCARVTWGADNAIDVVATGFAPACGEAACVDGRCEVSCERGCRVEESCLSVGERDPMQPCMICETAGTLVPVSEGEGCDDGLFCTRGDRCDAEGRCLGEARSCDDEAACSNDRCDEVEDRCVNDVVVGCLIDGACVTEGDVRDCVACQPEVETRDWSPLPEGAVCDDGAFCTEDDACDGAGTCAGVARVCPDDGVECTEGELRRGGRRLPTASPRRGLRHQRGLRARGTPPRRPLSGLRPRARPRGVVAGGGRDGL